MYVEIGTFWNACSSIFFQCHNVFIQTLHMKMWYIRKWRHNISEWWSVCIYIRHQVDKTFTLACQCSPERKGTLQCKLIYIYIIFCNVKPWLSCYEKLFRLFFNKFSPPKTKKNCKKIAITFQKYYTHICHMKLLIFNAMYVCM